MNELVRRGGITAALGGACGEQHDRRPFAACSRGSGALPMSRIPSASRTTSMSPGLWSASQPSGPVRT